MIVKGLNFPSRSFGAPLVVRVEPVGGSVGVLKEQRSRAFNV